MTGLSAPPEAMERVSSAPEARSLAAPALGVAAGSGALSSWSLESHGKRAQKPPTGGRGPAPRTRDSSLGSGDLLFRISLSKILMRKW